MEAFDPNAKYPYSPNQTCSGFTELMYYTVVQPNLNMIELLAIPDNINKKNNNGWTALMLACRNSSRVGDDVVELLLEKGADPNIKNDAGVPALLLACRYSNTDSTLKTVKLLLDYGADPNIQDNEGTTPLMVSCRYSDGDSNVETVELLLDSGADPNIQDNVGVTALIFATWSLDDGSNIETVKLLLQAGANVNLKSSDGWSALMLAGRYFNREAIELLLRYGAEPYEALGRCISDPCRKEISKGIWERIHSNIKASSSQHAKSTMLSKDIWELILLRRKQEQLCRSLSEKNRYVLMAFAEMLDIPVSGDMRRRELCTLISRQISWGGKYSEESVKYFQKERGRKDLGLLAARLGLDPGQPIDVLLSQISAILL